MNSSVYTKNKHFKKQSLLYRFNTLVPGKGSYILKQTYSFQLLVCLTAYNLYIMHLLSDFVFRKNEK